MFQRIRKAATRSISTKYSLLFALLVNLTVTLVLVSSGMIAFGQSEAVRFQVQEAVANAQSLTEERELRRTGAYLSHHLRAPLKRLDIARLRQQIDQVDTWLPVASFLILDPRGRILTDGSAENSRKNQEVALAHELVSRSTATVVSAGGRELQFAILDAAKILGYGKVVLAGPTGATSLESLDLRLYQVWNSYAAFLIGIGAVTLALVLCLAVVLIFILSRSLASPLLEMIQAARNYASGNLDVELPVRSDDELGQLAQSLNTMASDLKKKECLLTRAQEIANLGSWEWDASRRQLSCSRQAVRILDYDDSHEHPSIKGLLRHCSAVDRPRLVALFRSALSSNPFSFDFTFHRRGRTARLIRIQGQRNDQSVRGYRSWSGTIQDVTERQAAEERLNYLANYDALTGLPNRHLFQSRLRSAIRHAREERSRFALLFLDLDRFKGINDALGHGVGDEVLKVVARRLRHTIRDSDTVARLGGDEFTIIIESIGDHADVIPIARRVVDTIGESFSLAGEKELATSCSVGITIYPDDGSDVIELLKNADVAMYRSKGEGHGQYRFYTPEMNREAHERLTLESQLRTAVRDKNFALHYQPQLSLTTGEFRGAEALLRWRTDLGLIPPDKFIPVLEDSGMIQDLSAWVIETACRQVRSWHDAGVGDARIAVNLSARQFQQPDLAGQIDEILGNTGVRPEQLEIEITESVLLDPATINPIARHLVKRGIRLAIDDFGTGYSSLAYLKQLSVHTLKIDRSFIRDIPADPDDLAISTAIIDLCKSLGLEVVAEGVETVEQWNFLRLRGCDLIQGYLATKPLSSSEFTNWLNTQCRRVGHRYFWRVSPGIDNGFPASAAVPLSAIR